MLFENYLYVTCSQPEISEKSYVCGLLASNKEACVGGQKGYCVKFFVLKSSAVHDPKATLLNPH